MARHSEDIKKDVVDQLYWDDRVDASTVNVSVEGGMVRLDGAVPTLVGRHFAAAAALSAEGVRGLDNRLKVQYPASVTAPDDAQLRSNIENLLEWASHVDAEHVRVEVENGIVVLEGAVDALWKKSHVEDILLQLTGVTAIENKLTIVPTKDASDELIAKSLSDALKRNPTVNDDAVEVRVANGVVTLSGAVPNWAAREVVYNSALHAFGAIGVVDRLTVAE